MKKRMYALMIAILIFGSLIVATGVVLKLLHVPFYNSVLIAGLAFDFLGVVVYFLAVKDK